MARFFGWIPNVAGKLSFTLSGTSAYPNQFHQSANVGSGGRYFVGFQHRNLSDTTLPFFSEWPIIRSWIDNLVFNKDGNFVFLCLFKIAEDKDSASGHIYAFAHETWRNVYPRMSDKLNRIAEIWDNETVLTKEFDASDLNSADYGAQFLIKRNGIVEVDTVAINASPRLEISTHKFEHSLAAQCYFCLRDLLHIHRFHAPSSDTIIDVYPDMDTLVHQINFSLMRRALAARRVQSVEAQYRALGIISYLKAFRENLMTEDERRSLSFTLDATVAAVQAGMPLVATKEQRSIRNRLEKFKTTSVAFVSILFAYASLIRDSKVLVPDGLPWVKSAFTFVQERFGIALIGVVLLLYFLQILLSARNERRDAVVKTASRVALSFKIRRYGLFEIVIGAIFLALALLLLTWLVYRALNGPHSRSGIVRWPAI